MLKQMFVVLGTLSKFVLLLLSPVFLALLILIGIVIYRIVYEVKVNKKVFPKKGEYKNPSVIKRLFVMFPKQFAEDIFSREDFEFLEYGVHMICGEQGCGKTMFIVWLLRKWRAVYPNVKIATNMNYKFQDDSLTDWKGIVGRTNGKQGQVEVIDEIQTWFSSNNSRNFPTAMLGEVSQQRKQRKCIVGTAQVFSRVGKPIREQTHYVYMPFTIFGCITVVRKSHVKYWSEDKQKFKRYLGTFFFVHDSDLRNSYDTYLKIKGLAKKGFQKNSETIALTEI